MCRILTILFSVVIICSCSWSGKRDIVGKKLTVGTEKFAAMQNPRAIVNDHNNPESRKFTLVIYFGSGCCCACALKMMTVWDSIADELGRDDVSYRFIFSNSDGTPEYVFRNILSRYYFSFPLYIDKYDAFISDNPYVAQFETPLCLLLDENDVVLDYGRLDVKKKDLRRFRERIGR